MNANRKAISTQGLTKRFGHDILAVDRLDLTVPTNTIYALLGPNGAGKTTTLSMLTTLIEPSSAPEGSGRQSSVSRTIFDTSSLS